MGIELGELMAPQSGRILVGALDRIVYSSANYWAAMLSDLAAALAFLALGLNRFSGPWVVAGSVVIAGFMSSSLLEYILHRWVLHGPPSMAKRGHARHHADPRALISTPLFVIMTGALAIWAVVRLVLPSGVAALLVFGLYAGYHLQHHRAKDLSRVAYLRRLERLHDTHHHRQVVNYGISTTMWDRLLGTFQPTTEPPTDYRFSSTMRSYCSGDAVSVSRASPSTMRMSGPHSDRKRNRDGSRAMRATCGSSSKNVQSSPSTR